MAVWTRPREIAARSFRFLGRKELAIRDPFIPMIQSASERAYAASFSALYSVPSFRPSYAVVMASLVIDWSHIRDVLALDLVCWTMVLKINSPSRAASQALTISVTDLSLISFETAVSCFFPRPPIGLYSNVSGT